MPSTRPSGGLWLKLGVFNSHWLWCPHISITLSGRCLFLFCCMYSNIHHWCLLYTRNQRRCPGRITTPLSFSLEIVVNSIMHVHKWHCFIVRHIILPLDWLIDNITKGMYVCGWAKEKHPYSEWSPMHDLFVCCLLQATVSDCIYTDGRWKRYITRHNSTCIRRKKRKLDDERVVVIVLGFLLENVDWDRFLLGGKPVPFTHSFQNESEGCKWKGWWLSSAWV